MPLTDKARSYNLAQGSLEELRYYFILARDREYLGADGEWRGVDEVARLLAGYTKGVLTEGQPT